MKTQIGVGVAVLSALAAVGYFGTSRVDAAVLRDRLMAHGGAKLLE